MVSSLLPFNAEELFNFQGAQMDGDRRQVDLPGLKCGNCGEVLPRCDETIKMPGLTVRDRRCPKCGCNNRTAERVISTYEVKKYFRAGQ